MEILLLVFFSLVSGVAETELRSRDFDGRIQHIEKSIAKAEAGKAEMHFNPGRQGVKLAKLEGKIMRKKARLQAIKDLRDGKIENRRQKAAKK